MMLVGTLTAVLVIAPQKATEVNYALISTSTQLEEMLEKRSKRSGPIKDDSQIEEVLMTELIAAYVLGNKTLEKHPSWISPGERASKIKSTNPNIRALQAWWMGRIGTRYTMPDPEDAEGGATKFTYKKPDGSLGTGYNFAKGHPMMARSDKVINELVSNASHAPFLEAARYWAKPKYGEPTKLELEKAIQTCPKDLKYILIGPLATLEAKEGKKVHWWVEWKNLLKAPKRPLLVQHMLENSKILQQD